MKAVIASCLLLFVAGVLSVEWKHSAILDNNFLVLWTPGERDVMFEIQVKTLGYVGLGFTRDDGSIGADMVIGWVDNNGQLHLQPSPDVLIHAAGWDGWKKKEREELAKGHGARRRDRKDDELASWRKGTRSATANGSEKVFRYDRNLRSRTAAGNQTSQTTEHRTAS
ncbi:MOXD1 like protein 2 [Eufriesea mexicana]|nr:MOXD1 like protein 2 [Eufriesea mexicana]